SNPATEERLEDIPDHSPSEVESRLRAAGEAFIAWRRTPLDERRAKMHRAAAVLRRRSPELSGLMTREMGKPVAGAEAEVEKCAAACEHFADHSAEYLATER